MLLVEEVSFSYGGKNAVDGVSFEVDGGGLLFILGENGSGKSTLLKLIARIMQPQSGRILIEGRNYTHVSRRELSKIVVFGGAGFHVDFPISVFEYASLGRFPHTGFFGNLSAEDGEAVMRALQALGIAHLAGRSVLELSDGEKQKVAIAKMISQDGDLYLFDEPAAHLDLKSKLEVFELISSLADQGKAVVVTSHDVTLAGRYARDLLVLKEGKVFARGSVGDVLTPGTIKGAFGVDVRVSLDEAGRPIVIL